MEYKKVAIADFDKKNGTYFTDLGEMIYNSANGWLGKTCSGTFACTSDVPEYIFIPLDYHKIIAFEKACRPLIKYLCENHHPHVSVIVTPTGAELLEGKKTTGEILDYLKD